MLNNLAARVLEDDAATDAPRREPAVALFNSNTRMPW
jgi:hypothetical protein